MTFQWLDEFAFRGKARAKCDFLSDDFEFCNRATLQAARYLSIISIHYEARSQKSAPGADLAQNRHPRSLRARQRIDLRRNQTLGGVETEHLHLAAATLTQGETNNAASNVEIYDSARVTATIFGAYNTVHSMIGSNGSNPFDRGRRQRLGLA